MKNKQSIMILESRIERLEGLFELLITALDETDENVIVMADTLRRIAFDLEKRAMDGFDRLGKAEG